MVLCDTSLRNEELLSESRRPRAGGELWMEALRKPHSHLVLRGRSTSLGDLSGKGGHSHGLQGPGRTQAGGGGAATRPLAGTMSRYHSFCLYRSIETHAWPEFG